MRFHALVPVAASGLHPALGPHTWKRDGKTSRSWAHCQELHPRTLSLAPASTFCSWMFSESAGFFLACRFPKWPALASSLCGTLGMCSQNARFPPAPGSTGKEQLSSLPHSHSKERLGCTGFCHMLNLCISNTACSALHFGSVHMLIVFV